MTDTPDLQKLRYPIGKFKVPESYNRTLINSWIRTIEDFPRKLSNAVEGFSESQFDTPYRPGGWTVRQLIHHIADSHMNSIIRFKLGLTEDKPTIKTYREDAWGEMIDNKTAEAGVSLRIIESVHTRWVSIMKNMTDAEFDREIKHPEWDRDFGLKFYAALYAWHCDHHLAHILSLKKEKGW